MRDHLHICLWIRLAFTCRLCAPLYLVIWKGLNKCQKCTTLMLLSKGSSIEGHMLLFTPESWLTWRNGSKSSSSG